MYSILLVDDEPIVKLALRTVVNREDLGFQICGTASDGLEALKLIHEVHPDIIITDLKMPKMDGLELIKSLNSINYNGKIIILSNYGDYELVREALTLGAIDYILKISMKSDELLRLLHSTVLLIEEENAQKKLEQNKDYIVSQHIYSMKYSLLKEYFSEEQFSMEQLFENPEIVFFNKMNPCCLCYIHIDDSNHLSDANKITTELIQNLVQEYLGEIATFEIIKITHTEILFFFPEELLGNNSMSLKFLCEKIQGFFKTYMSIDATLCYCDKFIGYEDARKKYYKCRTSLNIQFYEDIKIIDVDRIHILHYLKNSNYRSYSTELLKDYTDGVEVKKVIEKNNLFLDNMKIMCIHPDIVKMLFTKVVEYIGICLEQGNYSQFYEYDSIMEDISVCNSFQILSSIIENFIVHLYNHKNTMPTAYKQEIVNTIQFINQNYQRKLTLDIIADHVNLNGSYLCRIFKTEVGKSIFNYINSLRMEKAAWLIKNKQVYIKEVCASVGIDDPFYFNRLFRKHFGVAPSEYKKH